VTLLTKIKPDIPI